MKTPEISDLVDIGFIVPSLDPGFTFTYTAVVRPLVMPFACKFRARPSALALAGALGVVASPALAGDGDSLSAHVHGVGALKIAIEGDQMLIALEAPGADIVGFEGEPQTDADRALVAGAMATLSQPLTLFTPPAAAGCSATEVEVELELEDDHDDHDHAEHGHSGHGHSGHGDSHGDSHGHSDHGHAHDKHAHDEDAHDKHAHDKHNDDEHADEVHSEFHAEYALTCADPSALTALEIGYFAAFPNAQELETQIVGPGGATSVEVERAAPTLDLSGAI